MRRVSGSADRWLWLILLTGLALHVLYATDQPTNALFRHYDGGDAGWYLANGAGFFSGAEHGYYRSISFYISRLPTPPFYILLTGVFQSVLPRHEAIVALRLAQCLLSVATAYLVFRLTLAITENERAGLLAAALLAWHPAFIAEANAIATETCYIFFVALGLWLYVGYVVDGAAGGKPRLSRGAGVCLVALALGMATLTRAVSALFPLVILLHLALLVWRTREKRWLRQWPLVAIDLCSAGVNMDDLQSGALGSLCHRQRPAHAGDMAGGGDRRWIAEPERCAASARRGRHRDDRLRRRL